MAKTKFFSARLSVWRLVVLGVLVNFFATLLAFAGAWNWALDLFNAFRVQYLVVLSAGVVLFSVRRHTVMVVIALIGTVLNASIVLPIYQVVDQPAFAPGPSVKLILFNVNRENVKHDDVISFIRREDPDVFGLLEVNEAWASALNALSSQYPYSKRDVRSDNFGIVLFSKTPITGAHTVFLSDGKVPTIIAQVQHAGRPINFMVTHPVPPLSAGFAADRNQQLQRLGELAKQSDLPLVLAGDLNTPPWSFNFRELVEQAGLHGSRQGFGLQPTWPSFMKILYTPIDHVLVSDHIHIVDRSVGPALGSDHHPVIVVFSVD